MSLSTLSLLFVSMLILSAVPGPADLAVVARSAAAGFAQAMALIVGVIAADLLFILAAFAGLQALAQALGDGYAMVPLACGSYLLVQGVMGWRVAGKARLTAPRQLAASGFVTGFVLTLGDPKAILFYLGFLPAFVDLSTAGPLQALLVMATAATVIMLVKSVYAGLGAQATRWLQGRHRRRLDRAAALVLILTGLYLIGSR